jgi:fibronectin-binding autotransporter adhesin
MNASFFAVKNYAVGEKLAGRILLIAVLALVLCPLSTLAQSCPGTTSWNGGTGDWETAGDWSSGVPGSASNACINVASSTVNTTATSGDTTLNLDINLGSDILNIGNNTQLTIQSGGNILNNGALNLNSDGNTTELIIDGATTLSGTGNVTMSNSSTNYITGGGTLTNKQTIQGGGNIGNNDLTLVNSTGAIIDANVVSTLQINPNGGTTNTGTLEATAGATLELSGATVANTGGLIQATGTSSTVELNDVSITGGTLTSSSGGVIESTNTWNSGSTPTLTGLTISSGTALDIPNNDGLNLGAGTITNNGTINLQSSGNNTELVIAGNTTLSGTGMVTMSNSADNIITGGGTLTNDETIQGAGNFGNGDLTLVNNGTINANQTTALNINPNGGTTNKGTMEATSGGTLELSSSTIANGSGLIEATGSSSTVELNDVSITGGTLTSSTGGVIESINTWNSSTPTLTSVTISSGSTLDIPNNDGLNFGAGTITNNGTINLQSSGNNTELVIAGNTTLSGTGTVTMSNSADNIILGGGTLTNSETIQGAGDIGDASLTLINNGTIDANQSAALTINPNGGTTNTKTMEATAGGTLVLATYAVNNAGGTVLATGTGSTVELNSVSITGGTLTSSSGGVIESINTWNSTTPTLTGLTISSGTTLDVPNNDGLNFGAGTITNNGTINLNSAGNNTELVITGGNVTLTGGGTITMSAGNINNMILAGTSGLMLTNVNNTISGTGQIGNGSGLLFVNEASGIVDASGGTLTISPYDSSTTTGSTTNQGLLEATAGGVLQLENTVTNTGGTILATGTSGGMSPTASTVELNGVSITGGTLTSSSGGVFESINTWNSTTPTLTTLTISSGTTLDIPNNDGLNLGAGTITNDGTINLQSSGNNTELVIAGSTTLSGTGTVMMSNSAGNIFTGGGTFTNGETIEGAGTIGDSDLTLVNNGTINANQTTALTINANGGTTNTKTMEATAGGTLHLLDYTINNTGGTILATGTNSAVTLDAVSISGGTLTSSSGGLFESVDTWNSTVPTITGLTISTGSTLNIPNNNGLDFGVGTITNDGTINLQSSGSNTELAIDGNVTLAGTGKVIMTANADNIILGTGTLTNDSTIEGEGNIGDGAIALVNEGTILANITAGGTLVIDPNSTGFTNNVATKNGVLTASAKNTIDIIGGGLTNYSSATNTLTGGTYNATGTIEFAAGSMGIVTNDATISLTSATGEILNSTTSTNALANFDTNGSKGSFSVTTQKFTDANEFTNDGILTVGSGGTLDFSTGLANFNSTTDTLAVGTYNVTGTLEFPGADIVINNAIITLTGTTPKILNSTTSANALAGFDDNKGTFTVNGGTFTDANSFTNSGTLAAGAKGLFNASGGLTNFNNTNGTLTGGSYTLTATGQIQFNNEGFANDIVTNDAKITLAGVDTTVSPFIDQSGNNALANFATNGASGSLLLTTDRVFTNAGSLTNAGIVNVEISSGTGKTELIIGGPGVYTQTGGTTTVDGVLSASGGINIEGGFLYGNALTTTGTEGTLIGPVDLTGGTLNPGNAVKLLGTIDITGTFTESGSGILNIDLDGTVAGTKYDVLNVSGTAALGGTIDFVLNSAFKPVVGDTWDVLNYASETGSFTNVELPTAPTGDTYVFACGTTDCTLTLEVTPGPESKPASNGSVTGAPATRVSRNMGAATSASSQEPTAILSRVTCFAARMVGSACGDKPSVATASHGGDLHEVASAHSELNSAHNNVLVATRSISSERGGASHETSASASAMARLYVCAYLPSTVGHTMGCN